MTAPILHGMDTATRPGDSAQAVRFENEAARLRRLARETEMIAEAEADIVAGRLVDSDVVDAWVDSIGTERELPIPYSGR
jgi:predicted transcriptional regulator